jgi:hypothetical protein
MVIPQRFGCSLRLASKNLKLISDDKARPGAGFFVNLPVVIVVKSGINSMRRILLFMVVLLISACSQETPDTLSVEQEPVTDWRVLISLPEMICR